MDENTKVTIAKLAEVTTGLEGEEALFAFWVLVGKQYVDDIRGTNSREAAIESAVEALEENLHDS